MVEEGVHIVPTLRNRVVIFLFIKIDNETKKVFVVDEQKQAQSLGGRGLISKVSVVPVYISIIRGSLSSLRTNQFCGSRTNIARVYGTQFVIKQ